MLRSHHANLLLAQLEKAGLSESAAAAVMAHCNPFNDFAYPLRGWPDTEARYTVPYVVTQEMMIKADQVEGDTLVDAVIVTPRIQHLKEDKLANGYTTAPGNVIGSSNFSGENMNTFTGVYYVAGPSGQNLLPEPSSPPAFTYPVVDHLHPGDYLNDGPSRIIGFGVEVRDTTAVLDQQGSLTSVRLPQINTDLETYYMNGAASGTNLRPFYSELFPPPNAGTALRVKGATQWEAKYGCYMPVFNTSSDNQLTSYKSALPLMTTTHPGQSGYCLTTTANETGLTSLWVGKNDCNAIYLSGLSKKSAILIIARWIIECAPDVTNIKMSSMSQPSCEYDPQALIYIAIIAKTMPVAMYVSENEDGGWFKGMMKVVRDWAPTIGSVIGTVVPGVNSIGNLLGRGAEALLENGKSLKKKKKAKQLNKSKTQVQGLNVPPQPTTNPSTQLVVGTAKTKH